VTIRALRKTDLPQVASLYATRLVNSTYAQLGGGFLRELIAGIDRSPQGIVLVDTDDAGVSGFMAAATDVEGLFAWLKTHRRWALGWRAALGLLRRPTLLPQLLRTDDYFAKVDHAHIQAELLYVAVRPELARSKLSSRLLGAMLYALHVRGATAVRVTCEKDNDQPQHLLRAFGFTARHEFTFYGKPMVLLAHDHVAEARLEK